jgi:hemolysin activation/secretion protein
VASGLCATPAPCGSFSTIRGSVVADLERPFGTKRLVLHTIAGAVGGRNDVIPPQELFYFGGPVSGPGYDFHQLVSRAGVSQRVEWRMPIPFFSVALGRFGKIPASATFAPYADVVALAGAPVSLFRSGRPIMTSTTGAYPSLGAGLLTFFDLVRFDVSRGLRSGRWLFSFDVNPEFWSVL